jgi:hypothetical protein
MVTSLGQLLGDMQAPGTGGPTVGRPVTAQQAVVPEGVVQPGAKVLAPFAAEPSRQWRDSTALLQVQRDGERFRVCGTNSMFELPWTGGERYSRPKLALGSLTDDEDENAVDPRDIFDLMPEWSRTHDEITAWINDLRARFGDEDLRIVIWDDTGFEIPWELLWLDPRPTDDLRPGWLGALVSVTRWTTIHRDGRNPYTDEPEECVGHVVAYFDEAMRGDFEALRPFCGESFSDVFDFIARLQIGQGPLSLVYMACHGQYGAKATRLELGGLHLRDLHVPLTLIGDSHSFIFLNACHSARLMIDPHLNDAVLRGFAEGFLRQGAGGVIGTAGKVGTDNARDAAQVIIEALARCDQKPVAAVLRDMRAQAALEVPSPVENPRQLLPFLYRFMYIYFGNPCTRLRLEARPP